MADNGNIVRHAATHLHKRHSMAATLPLTPASSAMHQDGENAVRTIWPQQIRQWLTGCRLANFIGYALGLVVYCTLSSAYAADVTRPAYTPPPPAVSTAGIMQIIFSLLLVLAVIVLVVWLLRRLNMAQQGSARLIKVLGGVSIGQRERIVLVEIEDTWLVVGVGPGQIRTLHTLQKSEFETTDSLTGEMQPQENKFAGLLSSILGQRKNGTGSK